MTTKTWARLAADGVTAAEIATFDISLVPGRDIPAAWSKDVTVVAGIQPGWTLNGSTWSAPVAVTATLAQLTASLVAAAARACDAITGQVNVTETHVPAYVNMARWVSQAGGVPTADPYKTAFANFAASLGATPANLAAMFLTFDVAPTNLLVALNALKAAAASPSLTSSTLGAAVTAFQTALSNEVAALNSALTAAGISITIVAPASISSS